jgi:hypothetical protein
MVGSAARQHLQAWQLQRPTQNGVKELVNKWQQSPRFSPYQPQQLATSVARHGKTAAPGKM